MNLNAIPLCCCVDILIMVTKRCHCSVGSTVEGPTTLTMETLTYNSTTIGSITHNRRKMGTTKYTDSNDTNGLEKFHDFKATHIQIHP